MNRLRVILAFAALVIALFGIFKSLDSWSNINRLAVYAGQALVCAASLIFALRCPDKNTSGSFRLLVIGYALLEALRVTLLQTGGVQMLCGVLAKFILAVLAVTAALMSDRCGKKEGLYLALAAVVMEIALYLVFLVGFPAVRTRALYIILPLAGILMAGSVCAFAAEKYERESHCADKSST